MMIFLKNTPNLTGATVYGDSLDFEKLYDALHEIVGSEDEWLPYRGARLRVLGVCYDIRHARMGNRGIEFVDNGMNRDIMRFHSTMMNDKNVYVSFNILWPELLFVAMVLNNFVILYSKKQAKNSYVPLQDYRNIWDPTIAHVRGFQAAVFNLIKETVSESTFSRLMKLINSGDVSFHFYTTQYIDELNLAFIEMNKEKRNKNISIMAKRIAEQGTKYQEVKQAVMEAARKYNCSITDIKSIVDYPEEIEW